MCVTQYKKPHLIQPNITTHAIPCTSQHVLEQDVFNLHKKMCAKEGRPLTHDSFLACKQVNHVSTG